MTGERGLLRGRGLRRPSAAALAAAHAVLAAACGLVATLLSWTVRAALHRSGDPFLAPETYTGLVSVHGLLMVHLVLPPALLGVTGSLLLPGFGDRSGPRAPGGILLALALHAAAAAAFLCALAAPGAGPPTGETPLLPLALRPGLAPGAGRALDLALVGVGLAAAARVFLGASLLATVREGYRTRAPAEGGSPLRTGCALAGGLLVVSQPVWAGAAGLLLAARAGGTAFLESEGGRAAFAVLWSAGASPLDGAIAAAALGVALAALRSVPVERGRLDAAAVSPSPPTDAAGRLECGLVVCAGLLVAVRPAPGLEKAASLSVLAGFERAAAALLAVAGAALAVGVGRRVRRVPRLDAAAVLALAALAAAGLAGVVGLLGTPLPESAAPTGSLAEAAGRHLLPGLAGLLALAAGVQRELPRALARRPAEGAARLAAHLALISGTALAAGLAAQGVAGAPRHAVDAPGPAYLEIAITGSAAVLAGTIVLLAMNVLAALLGPADAHGDAAGTS